MSERKVLNKYIPPDFDPSLIPRRRQKKDSQQVVRLMAPFSMRCNTCGEYVYKGKKFNARKETVEGETYYGIKIFRFYIKCTLCSAEITFKTDPKNTDYAAEHGASRNFEPWRDEQAVEEEDKLARLEAEENNPMKALENRTQDSKREMDILDALQDIRVRNARNERVAGQNPDTDILNQIHYEDEETEEDRERRLAEEEDEELVRATFSKIDAPGPLISSSSNTGDDANLVAPQAFSITVKRKADGVEPDLRSLLSDSTKSLLASKVSPSLPSTKKQKTGASSSLGIKLVKGKGKAAIKV